MVNPQEGTHAPTHGKILQARVARWNFSGRTFHKFILSNWSINHGYETSDIRKHSCISTAMLFGHIHLWINIPILFSRSSWPDFWLEQKYSNSKIYRKCGWHSNHPLRYL